MFKLLYNYYYLKGTLGDFSQYPWNVSIKFFVFLYSYIYFIYYIPILPYLLDNEEIIGNHQGDSFS